MNQNDLNVNLVVHPLIQHKLSIMRDKNTATGTFRRLLSEISLLLAYEVTRDLPICYEKIETPLTEMDAPFIEGKKLAIISILRAGNGLLDGILQLIPSARVGHIGLYRDPETYEAIEYYFKVPENMEDRDAIVVDPMLATGHSAAEALTRLKSVSPRTIKFMSLISAPEGIRYLNDKHPDVPIYTAAVDPKLDDHNYIYPGLGDAGDRIFGTK